MKKQLSEHLKGLGVNRPTVILDECKVRSHIDEMAKKLVDTRTRLRPHFKTHQSATIGQWFREAGVEAITVSSLEMAEYFAAHGWQDIKVAFPANPLEIDRINSLASRITLHLIVDSTENIRQVAAGLKQKVHLWIKVDVGYHRVGVHWQAAHELVECAALIGEIPLMSFSGILTHNGLSYGARGHEAIQEFYRETCERLVAARKAIEQSGNAPCPVSLGDTPCCRMVSSFEGIDEIRPGNFVFLDLMQWQIGSCEEQEIAVAVACPVIGKYPGRRQVVVYGGAVHLGKEYLEMSDGTRLYGYVARTEGRSWTGIEPGGRVIALSQEHGIIEVDPGFFEDCQIGDLLMILPVHSCITCDLFPHYLTPGGERIEKRQSNSVYLADESRPLTNIAKVK